MQTCQMFIYVRPGDTIISLVPAIQLQVLCLSQLLLRHYHPPPLFVCLFMSLFPMPTFPTCPPVSLGVLFPSCLTYGTAGGPVFCCDLISYHTLILNVFGVSLPLKGKYDAYLLVRNKCFFFCGHNNR